MRIGKDLQVGAATHTGRVRNGNEDDYLILEPAATAVRQTAGRWFLLADGMGGMSGGAEASRIAVRRCGEHVLGAAIEQPPAERLRRGFAAAAAGIRTASRSTPGLREMGTTLLVLNVVGARAHLAHLGDSRAYLLREGKLTQLTADHAQRAESRQLLRCIGGGRDAGDPDVNSIELQRDDVLLLATDGLWDTVPLAELREALRLPPQLAAERLIERANARGGPDNATALVVRVVTLEAGGAAAVAVDMPQAETALVPAFREANRRLVAARWPWLLTAAGLGASAAGLAKLFFDLDLLALAGGW